MQVCVQEAGVASSLLECIFMSCLTPVKLKTSAEHTVKPHNKVCLSGYKQIPAHPGSDALMHSSYVRLPPLDLLCDRAGVCVLSLLL